MDLEFLDLLGMCGQKSCSHLYKHELKRFLILIKCAEGGLPIPAEWVISDNVRTT